MNKLCTRESLERLCDAVFSKPGAFVAEAYSDYDQKPKCFERASELLEYMLGKLSNPKCIVDVIVTYPDMLMRPTMSRIELDPEKVSGHRFRYTWDGWGMISIQIDPKPGPASISRVTANSEARANKWAAIHPEFGSPAQWDWTAVLRHQRRLNRVFKQLM